MRALEPGRWTLGLSRGGLPLFLTPLFDLLAGVGSGKRPQERHQAGQSHRDTAANGAVSGGTHQDWSPSISELRRGHTPEQVSQHSHGAKDGSLTPNPAIIEI